MIAERGNKVISTRRIRSGQGGDDCDKESKIYINKAMGNCEKYRSS